MQRSDTPSPPVGPLVVGHYTKGQSYATHREYGTRDWLIIYTLGGHGRFGYPGGEFKAKQGDMILLKPNTLHDYRTAEGRDPHWELLWAHFVPRPAWMPWLDWPEIAPGLLHLRLAAHELRMRIVRRLLNVLALNAGPSRLREPLAMNALEEVLLRCAQANARWEGPGLDSRIGSSLNFICERFHEPLTVTAIAVRCGLSPSRFAHLFREQTGETPQRYLELQRLNRARQLLEFTQEPVAAVARQVGFENPFYFTLRFKRQSGVSPRAWRQGHRKPVPENRSIRR